MAFVYKYYYSVDEELSQRFQDKRAKYGIVVRTNFKVIDVNGAVRIIDSEKYDLGILDDYDFLYDALGERIRGYFMFENEAEELIDGAINFADELIAGGAQDRVTVVVVDLDVCTVQKNGEGIAATEDRAMKLEYLPPLHIYRVNCDIKPGYSEEYFDLQWLSLELGEAAISLYNENDVEKALGDMESCVVWS